MLKKCDVVADMGRGRRWVTLMGTAKANLILYGGRDRSLVTVNGLSRYTTDKELEASPTSSPSYHYIRGWGHRRGGCGGAGNGRCGGRSGYSDMQV